MGPDDLAMWWSQPPPNTLLDESYRPSVSTTLPPRTMGKGSVQRQLPPTIGQHDAIPRALEGIGAGMAGGLQGLGRLPRSWDDALSQWFAVMPGGGLTGIFAGRGARTANLPALGRAEEMATAGKTREEILSDTGWFRGRDGQWRFEIDDSADFHLRSPLPEGGGTSWFTDVFRSPATGEAYPTLLGGTQISRGPRQGSWQHGDVREEGVVIPHALRVGPGATRSTIGHEVQHGVQRSEGFARGGDANTSLIPSLYNQLSARINSLIADAGGDLRLAAPEIRAEVEALRAQQRALPRDPTEAYRRLAGEVEARNVQTRMDMTPADRRARPPWTTQDVPDDQQILR
jgi:hypothetical protein